MIICRWIDDRWSTYTLSGIEHERDSSEFGLLEPIKWVNPSEYRRIKAFFCFCYEIIPKFLIIPIRSAFSVDCKFNKILFSAESFQFRCFQITPWKISIWWCFMCLLLNHIRIIDRNDSCLVFRSFCNLSKVLQPIHFATWTNARLYHQARMILVPFCRPLWIPYFF